MGNNLAKMTTRQDDNTSDVPGMRPLRESRGVTLEKLAEFLGCDVSTLSRYEAGKRRTPMAVAKKAAIFFDCDLSRLTEEAEANA